MLCLLALVAVGALPGAAGIARADGGTTVAFSYTGAAQTWTVPTGVTSVQVTADGAQGDGTYGGLGSRVTATLSVTPGSTLNVYVGGRGSGSTGGWNGGGGGNPYGGSPGGGESDVRIGGTALSNRVLVAGGGGGQAIDATPVFGMGGSGGGLAGEAGGNGSGSWAGGGGGTQTAGGAWGGGLYGSGGSLGQGGGGTYHGGDGGGGYYGGGAGGGSSSGGTAGGGGGGSSYATPSAIDVTYAQGFHGGDGHETITYPPSTNNATPTPGSMTFTYTGGPQQWTVPDGVTSLQVKAAGAQGGGTYGGFGAVVNATIAVVPGESLTVFVGGQGSGATGGFNGGGGGNPYGGSPGGGASDVRIGGVTLADRMVVAGGGGGDSNVADSVHGGGGSARRLGEAGGAGDGSWPGGGGGTQTAGGAWGGGLYGSSGSLGQGGGGTYHGGDGGGGYYGGGAGGGSSSGGSAGGGGGGSSYARPGSTGVTFIAGARPSDGQVVLTWPPAAPTVPSPPSTTANFSYTGAPQYWTVPDGVNEIAASAAGAQGASGGGLGGSEQGLVTVTPGQVVTVMVGGVGSGTTGGFNGGGGGNPYGGGPGGGASDVRVGGAVLADRLVVAGGGGGGAVSGAAGGGGGGLSGQPGADGSSPGGGGGTQTAGGAWGGGLYGSGGSLGQGGGGTYQGGDGGGGYYGGGAGGGVAFGSAGGGGGGSSYAAPSVNQPATQAAVNSGNGSVTIYTGSAIPGNTPLANTETLGGDNPSEPGVADGQDVGGDGVNTATAGFSRSFTDLQIPGRGLPLDLERTYNSGSASVLGPFGYGWSFSYAISLTLGGGGTQATIVQENGSQVVFNQTAGGSWVAAPRVQANLVHNAGGSWTFSRQNSTVFTFNSAGQLTAETDLNGYATTLAYNGSNQLTTVTDPASRTLTFAYWPSGLVKTVTDSGARSVSYGYDANNNLTSVIDVRGGETDFTYDTSHQLLTLLDPNQHGLPTPHPLTNVYSSGQLITQTDPMLRVTHFDYTTVSGSTIVTEPDSSQVRDAYSNGQLSQQTLGYGTSSPAPTPYTYDPASMAATSQTDPNSHVSVNNYDAQGNTTASTDPLGNTNSATYNSLGQPLTAVDAAGITTSHTYDTAGNTLTKTVTGSDGSPVETTQYTYGDGAHPGDVTQVTDPAGYVTDYTYDSYGDRTSTTTHPTTTVANTTKSVYDALGRVVCRASANATAAGVVCPAAGQPRIANTTTWIYDAAGHITSVTDPVGNATSNVYDANGNHTQVTDPATNVTKKSYDPDDELKSVITGFGTSSAATTGYLYLIAPGTSPCSAAVTGAKYCNTVTDPKGNVTVDYLNALGKQIQETQPSSGTTSSSYDLAGNLTGQTTAAGTATFTYDVGDRQRSIVYSSPAFGYAAAPNVTFAYDAAGHRTTMTDGSGTTSYRYDSLERLSTVINGNGSEVDYAYNNDDAVTDITYPGTNTAHYGYDTAGEATTVIDWLSHTTNIGYDHNANPTSEALPNGDTSTVGFNNNDQLTSISDAPTGTPGSPFATFGYTRNPDSQVGTETNTGVPAPTAQTYGYDPLSRLTSSTSGSYTYNLGGDPTQLANGTKQTFTTPGQLTTATNAITLVGTASNQSTATTSLALTLPAGLKASDQILLAVDCANSVNPNTPSGYTLVNTYTSGNPGTADKVVLYRRTAQTGDTTATVTFGTSSAAVVTLAVYRGVNPSSPIDTSNFGKTTSGTSVVAPSITTTLAGDQLVLIEGAKYGGSVAGTFTQPSGVTSRVSLAAGFVLTGAIADQPLPTAGATGTRTVNFSVSAALVAVAVALKPAQTGYGYNSRGDRTSITGPTGTVTNLSYDQTDRLVGYGASVTYSYNGDGLRTSKTVSGVAEPFTWDTNAQGGVPRLLVDGTTSYIYEAAGHPLEQITSGGAVSYYLHDQIGSTRLLTSSTGAVSVSYTYDAYGTLAGSTGSAVNPLGYVGAYTDSESSASYFIHRYYDPATAVFLTVDPIASSTNEPYNYAGQDPVDKYDLDGRCPGPSLLKRFVCPSPPARRAEGAVHALVSVAVTHTLANASYCFYLCLGVSYDAHSDTVTLAFYCCGVGEHSSTVGADRPYSEHPATACLIPVCVGWPPSVGYGSGVSWEIGPPLASLTIRHPAKVLRNLAWR